MILKVMSPCGLGSIIHANFETQTVSVENYSTNPLYTAFGVNTNPTWKDFETDRLAIPLALADG